MYPDLVQYKGQQIGQTILTDISINGNSVTDPGCLKHYLAFQWFSVGQWFYPGTPFPPTLSEIPEILFYSGVKHQMIKKTSHTFMSSFIQQLYSIVQYPDSIFQLHDSIILCFVCDVRYRFRANWQYRYYQHPKYIHNMCLRHPSISYPLFFYKLQQVS